jgi:aminoglycoside 6'-N-acetyltransferase I
MPEYAVAKDLGMSGFIERKAEIKALFNDVFGSEPWNEKWSNDQLEEYLRDLTEVRGMLVYGLFDGQPDGGNPLIGIAIGRIKHWCEGTEYYIEETCIARPYQGKGYGRLFFDLIERDLISRNIRSIFLMTDADKPASGFYRKIGFTELPGLTSFYKDFSGPA